MLTLLCYYTAYINIKHNIFSNITRIKQEKLLNYHVEETNKPYIQRAFKS